MPHPCARPYITVGLNDAGGVCWLVVTADCVISCDSGKAALAELKAATNPLIDPGRTV
jgi:hypothetical protein